MGLGNSCRGDQPVHYRMLSITPDLCQPDASTPPHQVVTTKYVFRHCQMSPGWEIHPHLRTTGGYLLVQMLFICVPLYSKGELLVLSAFFFSHTVRPLMEFWTNPSWFSVCPLNFIYFSVNQPICYFTLFWKMGLLEECCIS